MDIEVKNNNSIKEFAKDHIAVSSLESPLHAVRKDPKIISVLWFIGKRCNYDCSYCPSYTHDNFSLHIDKKKAFEFIDEIEKYSVSQEKTFKISITGGEPFVHPDFMEILKYISSKKNLTQLVVVSNGSLPLDTYLKSLEYITNLTISLHLEQNEKTINDTINKIINLNKNHTWINVNLMMLPNKLSKIKDIIKVFNSNNIKFVLAKIDPPVEDKQNTIQKGDLEKILEAEKNYLKNKFKIKTQYHSNLSDRHKIYYSAEELDYIENFNNKNQWNNIKLHQENKTLEINTSELVAKNLNSWKDWYCYIGIDTLYVQHDGTIFRGSCMQGNIIGKIGKKINWPNSPLKCPIKTCVCNSDMITRKVIDLKYKHLIDDNINHV